MRKPTDTERRIEEAILFSKRQTEEILASTVPLPFVPSASLAPEEATAEMAAGSVIYALDRQALGIGERDALVLSAVAKSALYARLAQIALLNKAERPRTT